MTQNSNHSVNHIIPTRTYLFVFSILILLTAITVAVSFIPLGGYNVVVALIVAGMKASLVALFFMHLLYDNKFYLVIFLSAVTFLTVFIIFTMFDTMNRGDIYQVRDQVIHKQAPIYETIKPENTDHQ